MSDPLRSFPPAAEPQGAFSSAVDSTNPPPSNIVDPADAADLYAAHADGLAQEGRWTEAAESYRAAVVSDPGRIEFAIALVDALLAGGAAADALAEARSAAERWPERGRIRLILARGLAANGAVAEAADHLREAIFLSPQNTDIMRELGVLLLRSGDAAEAIALLQRCRRVDPDDPETAFQLGAAWQELGDTAKSGAAYRDCLALDPEDRRGAAYRLAELSDSQAATTRTYVRTLFDQYAERFDDQLVRVLRYGVPGLIREMLAEELAPAPNSMDVIDLGCGTGLAGVELATWARRLAGIDLAQRMVARAAERGIYSELAVGDLVERLRAEPEVWDLAVAADVLIYLGDLAPSFAAVAMALRPGGHFVGSVERLDDGRDYALGATRRYAYGRNYLERAAAAEGLSLVTVRDAVLRQEKGRPVEGYVFLMRKPDVT